MLVVALVVASSGQVEAAVDLGTIMPLGDSITAGGYRRYLYTELKNRGYAFLFVGSQTDKDALLAGASPPQVKHEGHGGYRILDIESNLEGLNEDTTGYPSSTNNGGYWLTGIAQGPNARPPASPRFILLHIGTNDINWTPPQGCIDHLRKLVTRLVNARPEAHLLVASLVPRSDTATNEARNQRYNELIPTLLQEAAFRGKRITFVDMHAALTTADIGDTLHPTNAGYLKMAKTWAAAIEAIVKRSDTPTDAGSAPTRDAGEPVRADAGMPTPDADSMSPASGGRGGSAASDAAARPDTGASGGATGRGGEAGSGGRGGMGDEDDDGNEDEDAEDPESDDDEARHRRTTSGCSVAPLRGKDAALPWFVFACVVFRCRRPRSAVAKTT